MPKLIYTVEVHSGDLETDTEYLETLRATFIMIAEQLVKWGYTGDESVSHSRIEHGETS